MKNAKPFPITREQVQDAFRYVKANRGGVGVDNQSIEDFENRLDDNLYKLWNRMASGSYFPKPVRAVSIPKKSGGERILGIPTVCDRIAQTVVKMMVEPVLDPVFDEDSYGFRPGRSAHQALATTQLRCRKYAWVVEFDIRKLFDQIDHDRLMKAVRFHIPTKWILLYLERWMKAPLQFSDGSKEYRGEGVPQGGVVSPILANVFMHYTFDMWMRRTFPKLPFCRYADDGLIHCHSLRDAQRVLEALEKRLLECGLQAHPDKTKVIYCQDANRRGKHENTQFSFLGYTFGPRRVKTKSGLAFSSFGPAISQLSEKAIREKIKDWNLPLRSYLSIKEVAQRVRKYIQGWMNYYCVFNARRFERIGAYINKKLLKWAMRKFKGFRGRRERCIYWLALLIRREPHLFPHWGAGFTRIVG